MTTAREDVWLLVAREMHDQDLKWGQQDHPASVVPGSIEATMLVDLIAPSTMCRIACDNAAERGAVTWAHILLEEVSEFIDSATPSEQRAELIQVAAVVHQAIAALDRQHPPEAFPS